MSLGYEDCKVFVSTVDSQGSAENGIVIQVVGELSNKAGPWRKFAQTFFLAEQPNGYFVLNDIFRFIKEESDDDDGEPEDEAAAANKNDGRIGRLVVSGPDGQITQTDISAENAHDELAPFGLDSNLALHHSHGPTHSAADVTIAPPSETHHPEAQASLQSLVNGHAEAPEVVHLQDDLARSSLNEGSSLHPRTNGTHVNEPMNRAVTPPAPSPRAAPAEVQHTQKTPEPIRRPSAAAAQAPPPAEPEAAAAPVKEEAPAPEPAEATPQQPSQPAAAPEPVVAPAPQQPAKPAGPPVPKTWANLAATNNNRWKTQVVSGNQAASSTSAAASGTSTPAEASTSAAASTSQPAASSSNASPSQNRPPQGRDDRGPPRFENIETPYSVIFHGVTQDVSHKQLRDKVSDDFADRTPGAKPVYARLAYLDIDRSKGIAYVDFEKESYLNKALSAGKIVVEGVTLTIEAGKGNRRDASGPLNRPGGDRPQRGNYGGSAGRGSGMGGPGRGGQNPSMGRGAPQGQQRGSARGGHGRGQNE